MKTEQEVKTILQGVCDKIETYQELSNHYKYTGDNNLFKHYDREYAKCIAQYNILLEVLK